MAKTAALLQQFSCSKTISIWLNIGSQMEDTRNTTWQPEGWRVGSQLREKRDRIETWEATHGLKLTPLEIIYIIRKIDLFYFIAISRGRKMICALCKRSDETKTTGTLSSKEGVAAHQNCLVNIPLKREKKTINIFIVWFYYPADVLMLVPLRGNRDSDTYWRKKMEAQEKRNRKYVDVNQFYFSVRLGFST